MINLEYCASLFPKMHARPNAFDQQISYITSEIYVEKQKDQQYQVS